MQKDVTAPRPGKPFDRDVIPRPLQFTKTSDDGTIAVYSAVAQDRPDRPGCAVTVSVSSPEGPADEEDMTHLLAESAFGFSLTRLPADEDGDEPGDEAPFDPETEILFEFSLTEDPDVPVRVDVLVESWVAPPEPRETPPGAAGIAAFTTSGKVLRDKRHHFRKKGKPGTATVSSRGNPVTLSPPKRAVPIPPTHSVTANDVFIGVGRGVTFGTYRFEGTGFGEPHEEKARN